MSKYIHSPRSIWTKRETVKNHKLDMACVADRALDLSELSVWSDHFREVFFILFKVCLHFEPLSSIAKEEDGKLAFYFLKERLIDVVKEINRNTLSCLNDSDKMNRMINQNVPDRLLYRLLN